MPYQPRPLLSLTCAHCGRPYTARHVRSTYCSHSCNVRASHARNGRRPARAAAVPVVAPVAVVPVAPVLPLPVPAAVPVPVLAAAPVPGPSMRTLDFVRQLHDLVVSAVAARERTADIWQWPPEKATELPTPAPE